MTARPRWHPGDAFVGSSDRAALDDGVDDGGGDTLSDPSSRPGLAAFPLHFCLGGRSQKRLTSPDIHDRHVGDVKYLTDSVRSINLDAVWEFRRELLEGPVETITQCHWPGTARIELHDCTTFATMYALLRRMIRAGAESWLWILLEVRVGRNAPDDQSPQHCCGPSAAPLVLRDDAAAASPVPTIFTVAYCLIKRKVALL